MTAGTQQQKKGKLQPKQQITSEIGAFDSHRISIIRGALSSDECGKRQFALLHYKLQTLQICWNHWQFLQLLQISGCPPVEPSERVIKGMHAEFLRFKSQLWRRVVSLQHLSVLSVTSRVLLVSFFFIMTCFHFGIKSSPDITCAVTQVRRRAASLCDVTVDLLKLDRSDKGCPLALPLCCSSRRQRAYF